MACLTLLLVSEHTEEFAKLETHRAAKELAFAIVEPDLSYAMFTPDPKSAFYREGIREDMSRATLNKLDIEGKLATKLKT
jgi:hypothetical protein